MKLRKIAVFVTAGFVISLCTAFAAGLGAHEDFSADMVMKTAGHVMQGRIYVSGQKVRMENPMSTIITRPDLQLTWVVMPEQQMYMEQPLDLTKVPKTSREVAGEISREEVGTETIDGKAAKKFKVIYTEEGRQSSMYQWLTDGVAVPIKMESLDGSWSMEYRDVRVGTQPDVIFEPPMGYQKMAMPNMADMMQQALQGN